MLKSRPAASFAVDVMCRVAGRQNMVRGGRFLINRARIDFGFDMHVNGEYALQGWMLDILPSGERIHVIDAGANVGDWSRPLLQLAESRGRLRDVDLHAFEPSSTTFRQLTGALGGSAATLQQAALSDRPGEMTLHIAPGRSFLNSLHDVPGTHTGGERVTVTTLDGYAERTGLSRIDLLKVDAEGHDLAVLEGACELLQEGRIAVAQFEYNDSWIYARRYLRDAYSLLEPLGYQLGKLTPFGVELYPEWSSALETFRAAMYVVCRKDMAEQLPQVADRDRLARVPGVTA